MTDLLDKLLASLKKTSLGARLIVVLVGAAMCAIVGLMAVATTKPHYELAFSGLDDHELAQVCKALSDAGIPFEQSQPPGPFVVYVDEEERTSAYMAAYGAGALDKPLEGILSEEGAASVFHSAEERAQGVRKREWQEMEKMLEELDFVAGARVRTSITSSSPLVSGREAKPSASVTLRVAGAADLTREQAATVAKLVSRGLGVAKEDLVISDQTGRSLYDGRETSGQDHEVTDLLAHQGEHDRRLALESNTVLEEILGPNKARVHVSSEWDFTRSTLHEESPVKSLVVMESKKSSEKPSGSSGGQAVGVSANTLDPDLPGAAPVGSQPASATLLEKTNEEKKEYSPSVTREEVVRFVPEMKRLSVALFLDQSVGEDHAKLEEAIKAAVGFDEERGDTFSSVVLPFATAGEPAPGSLPAAAAPPAETSSPNPLLDTLLRRAVEVASALLFLVLLWKTLKGSQKPQASTAQTSTAATSVDAELLARAQVDELLKSDPAKVGEILSRWAREEPVTTP
jgi:flagellar M-ring protein FliF